MRNWFVSVIVVFAGLSHAALSAQQRAPVIDMHMHAHHIPLKLARGSPTATHACACRSTDRAVERKARRARGPQPRLVGHEPVTHTAS